MSRTRTPAIARLAHRRVLLETMIASVKSSFDVSNRDLRPALTKNEYDAYLAELRSIQPSLRKLPSRLIAGIQSYVALLRKADSLHDRAENTRHVRMVGLKHFRLPSLYQRSEGKYEHALEVLNDLVCTYPGVASLFDRPVIFKMDDEPILEPESMPRLHTSRSPFALHIKSGKQSSIFRLKLETLQASLTALYGGAGEPAVRSILANEELDNDLLSPDADHFDSPMLDVDLL